ncbi:MAG: sulfatase-like hydrolase/transferase [bacterium]|nr:sulfatase-like hydrolase/transferase [bacterium]
MTKEIKQEFWRWRIYIILFFSIHIFNAFFILAPAINHNMNPFDVGLVGNINAFFGNTAVLAFFCAAVFLLSNQKKTILRWLTFSTILLSIMVFLLKVYVFYYGSFFSFYIIQNFSNPASEMALQLTITTFKMIFYEAQFVTLLPIVIIVLYNHFVLRKDIKERPVFWVHSAPKKRQGAALIIVGFALISISGMNASILKKDTHEYFNQHRVALYGVQTMGAFHYYISEIVAYVSRSELVYTQQQRQALDEFIANEIMNPCYDLSCTYTDEDSPFHGMFAGKNLVLIQLESLNTFYLGLESNGQKVLPFLSNLVLQEDVLFFNKFYASNGIGKTTDAEFAALTGMYPTGFTVSYFDHVTPGIETLPKLFASVGYTNIAVHGSPTSFYDRVNVHPLMGFDESYGTEQIDPLRLNQINGWTDDLTVFRFAKDKMMTQTDPFFMLLLATVSHLPYFPQEGYTNLNDWGIRSNTMISNSFDYFYRLDQDLQVLFEDLQETDFFNDTVFIMYGDHTSGLTYQDIELVFGKMDNQSFQEMLHSVPLIIYSPNTTFENIITSKVRSQVDIKRTVANLFDLPIRYFFGVDALSPYSTVAYNPQTFDIAGDSFYISATRNLVFPRNSLTKEQMDAITTEFFRKKNLNDLLLKGQYFRLI